MAKNKTTETTSSVPDFVNAVADETKRNDCFQLIELMQKQTGLEAKMWGPSIVGFGSYHYKYESGREGDMPLVSFSPRASSIVLYISLGDQRATLLAQLGKHKTDKGCIHVKKLSDVDTAVLEKMVIVAVQNVIEKHPNQSS